MWTVNITSIRPDGAIDVTAIFEDKDFLFQFNSTIKEVEIDKFVARVKAEKDIVQSKKSGESTLKATIEAALNA